MSAKTDLLLLLLILLSVAFHMSHIDQVQLPLTKSFLEIYRVLSLL